MITHRLKANSGIDVIRDLRPMPFIVEDDHISGEQTAADPLGAAKGLCLAVPMSACLWALAGALFMLAHPLHF